MARSKLPRNVRPGPSNDPADKLYACLNYRMLAANGTRACQRIGGSKWGDEHAKKWAAKLSPAPRCPL
jgi:hypothetical protein